MSAGDQTMNGGIAWDPFAGVTDDPLRGSPRIDAKDAEIAELKRRMAAFERRLEQIERPSPNPMPIVPWPHMHPVMPQVAPPWTPVRLPAYPPVPSHPWMAPVHEPFLMTVPTTCAAKDA